MFTLLFFRPQKSILSYPTEDDDIEEEVDEVVPDGVEEVELARIDLEQKEREIKLLIDDIRSIESSSNISMDLCLQSENESEMWMITGKKSTLVNFIVYYGLLDILARLLVFYVYFNMLT